MTTLTAYKTIDMLNKQIWYGTVTSATNSSITISDYYGNRGTYYGSFEYNGNSLAGGIVTGYDSYSNYGIEYTVRNGSFNALVVKSYLDRNDATGLSAYVLSGTDNLSGSSGADFLKGLGGNDRITGSAGNDTIDGGEGVDIAVYSGSRSSYILSKAANTTIVQDSSSRDGTDTLSNVERLQFSDTTVALDISGTAGQAYRIYQAAFNRTPDNSGLKYWIGLMDGGISLPTVSSAFIASSEFKALYGANPTNDLFVAKLYNNVLHRTPDAGGYNYWVGFLNTGKIDNISVLINFSESTENQAGVIGVIQNGIDLLN